MHEGGRATVDELDWSGHRPTASYSDSKPACSSEAILRGASAPRAKRLRGRSLSRFLAANCVQAVASRSSGGTAAGLPGARTDPSRALSDLARVAYASPASVPSVGASSGTDAAWSLPAVPSTVRELRRRAIAFASAAGASRELTDAVALAVSEIVTNAVMHAYVGREPGPVAVQCRTDGERMSVRVIDEGAGLAARDDSPGIGHGLATVGALAQALEITSKPDGSGTVVTMSFGPSTRRPATPGFEPLCALALERVADVSCVDLVHGGVLRRTAARVAGDPALTAWLRGAVPPTKPGTATWRALREGGAPLVVHDPSVPRSPGGTGERLQLTWWVAVPLERSDGAPAALWGLGGRDGGRPVPSDAVLRALIQAAATDLAQEGQRARLRAHLALA
jgi:serine/threonine-protein kinase RsbW